MKTPMSAAMKAAFPKTIPIIPGYLVLGIAFGVLLTDLGYAWFWAPLMSVLIYSGMAQFIAVNMLAPGVSLINTFLLQLTVNARHTFYGLSLLEKFKTLGKTRPYMIYALTDETYSLLCSAKPPTEVSPKSYYFFIALFDQCYWIIGSLLGGILGSLITFNTTGIDFTMTALFITICIDQWRETKNHIPVLTGFGCTVICLLIFGADSFVLPALFAIAACLLLFRKQIETRDAAFTAAEGERLKKEEEAMENAD